MARQSGYKYTIERRTLSKFNHKWLPLQDRYHVHSSSPDNSCPSCWQAPKTPAHFLACTHHERTHIWKELHDQLQQHQIKNNISTIFYDLLAFGLYQGRQAPHNITFTTYHRISRTYKSGNNALAGHKSTMDDSLQHGSKYYRPTTPKSMPYSTVPSASL